MNEQHPLQSFIALVAFDQELVSLENAIKSLEQDRAGATNSIAQLEQAAEEARRRLVQARKDVDEKELEMKELEEKRIFEKERLEQVTNEKEYKAVRVEIERLKQRQGLLDEALLNAWNRLEVVQKEVELLVQDSAKKIEEQQAVRAEKQVQVTELLATLSEQVRVRAEKEKCVPADWLERYAMMRARVTDPVVSVLSGSCSACFWSIPQQDMLQLRRGKLLQCNGCFRFLYASQEQSEGKE